MHCSILALNKEINTAQTGALNMLICPRFAASMQVFEGPSISKSENHCDGVNCIPCAFAANELHCMDAASPDSEEFAPFIIE